MKTSCFSRSYVDCSAHILFKNILFVLFFLTSVLTPKSFAQCIVDAGRNRVVGYNMELQLQAWPRLQGSWKEHPKKNMNTYMDACFINDTSMVVVGSGGSILKFSNDNWHEIASGVTTPINAVDFYDDKNGIAVGSNDLILKTTDGGDTWIQITSATGYLFYAVQYLNSQTIIISGYQLVTGQPVKSGFLRSVDGGNNWDLMAEISGFRITSFDFVNSSVGFACGNNKGIFKTTDGGSNWQPLTLDNIPTTSTFDQIKAASANDIYAVGYNGRIIKSNDGGNSWMDISPLQVLLPSFNNIMIDTKPAMFKSIVCFSPNHITVTGFLSFRNLSWIMTSYDAGETWEEEKVITGITPRIHKLARSKSEAMIASCDDGVILTKTPDDQFEWSPAAGLSNAYIPDPIAISYSTTNYTVTRTSGNCTATDEVTVYVRSYSENDKNINCGQAVQLDKVPYHYNFTGNVRYKWTPATGLNSDTIAQPICTATEATQYTGMAILNDGNSFIDSVFTRQQFVTVNSFDVNAGDDIHTVCGSTVALNVQHYFSGSENVSYKWYPADGLDDDTKQNPVAAVLGNITYTVAVTTAAGCVAYDDVNIIATAFQPETYSKTVQLNCGSSVKLDSIKTNYSGFGQLIYKWSPATGLDSDSIASPVCSASTNTTYKVTITTPAGNSTSANVIVQIVPMQINAGSNKSFYCGEQVQLDSVTANYSGTGLLRYKWTPSTGLINDTIPNPIVTSEDTRDRKSVV